MIFRVHSHSVLDSKYVDSFIHQATFQNLKAGSLEDRGEAATNLQCWRHDIDELYTIEWEEIVYHPIVSFCFGPHMHPRT